MKGLKTKSQLSDCYQPKSITKFLVVSSTAQSIIYFDTYVVNVNALFIHDLMKPYSRKTSNRDFESKIVDVFFIDLKMLMYFL